MTTRNRSWDVLSEEQRRLAVKDIIDYFTTERDEEIGIVAAEAILDMFLQATGISIYNKGVDDTKEFFKNRIEEVYVEADVSLRKD